MAGLSYIHLRHQPLTYGMRLCISIINLAAAETFSVAESVLSIKTSLTDRTLRKVRKELMQWGSGTELQIL